MDEWIRLFNAETTEDLDMIKAHTKNTGILEASLIADNRFEDLERSIKDKTYREQLYKEYGI